MKKVLLFFLITMLCHLLSAQSNSITERCLTTHPAQDRYASYSPDGEWIVFESDREGHWGIYLMDKRGKNVQRISTGDHDCRRPSWHPGGKKILYEALIENGQELISLTIKNGKEKKLSQLPEKGEFIFASYAPNGKYIAVSQKDADTTINIVLLNRKGKWLQNLTHNRWRNVYPKWSADGKKLVYFSRKETNNQDDEIYTFNVETGEHRRLTNWPTHNFCPSWSADGQKIAYVTSMENSRPEIYLMDADGKNPIRLTHNEDGDTLPNWHPSENKILITAYRNGNYEICELEW